MAFVSTNLELCTDLDFGRTVGGVGQPAPGLNDAVRFSDSIDLAQNRHIAEGAPCYIRIGFTEDFTDGAGTPRMYFGISFNDDDEFETPIVPGVNYPKGEVQTVSLHGTGQFYINVPAATGPAIPGGLGSAEFKTTRNLWLPMPVMASSNFYYGDPASSTTIAGATRFMALSFWQPRINATSLGTSDVAHYFASGKITATIEPVLSVNSTYPSSPTA